MFYHLRWMERDHIVIGRKDNSSTSQCPNSLDVLMEGGLKNCFAKLSMEIKFV